MNLDEAVLQKVADWRPESRQTRHIGDESSGCAVTVTADRADDLSCQLWEATVRRPMPEGGLESLRSWAQGVADRVTSLLEPLHVVEVDVRRDEALLRSQQPSQRGEQLSYYEMLLKGAGEASIRRYRSTHQSGQRRQQTPYVLTHEALAKLVSDIVA